MAVANGARRFGAGTSSNCRSRVTWASRPDMKAAAAAANVASALDPGSCGGELRAWPGTRAAGTATLTGGTAVLAGVPMVLAGSVFLAGSVLASSVLARSVLASSVLARSGACPVIPGSGAAVTGWFADALGTLGALDLLGLATGVLGAPIGVTGKSWTTSATSGAPAASAAATGSAAPPGRSGDRDRVVCRSSGPSADLMTRAYVSVI